MVLFPARHDIYDYYGCFPSVGYIRHEPDRLQFSERKGYLYWIPELFRYAAERSVLGFCAYHILLYFPCANWADDTWHDHRLDPERGFQGKKCGKNNHSSSVYDGTACGRADVVAVL